jgi:hypothetical protein
MYRFLIHTSVGTFKSNEIPEKDLRDTITLLKENAGRLTYLEIKDVNGLPIYISRGILENAVITVEKIPS